MSEPIENMNFEDIFENHSSITDKLILFLFPHLELQSTKYEILWQQISKRSYKKRSLILMSLASITSFFQMFLDKELGLEPEQFFFLARLSCSVLSIAVAGSILTFKAFNIRAYKLLMILVLTTIALIQVELTIIEPKVPFIFTFGMLTIGVFALDLSIGASLIYLASFF